VELLATFPDPDPTRLFAAERCVHALLRGGGRICEITREVGSRKGLLQRSSFWSELMAVAGAAGATYAGYSYKDARTGTFASFPWPMCSACAQPAIW